MPVGLVAGVAATAGATALGAGAVGAAAAGALASGAVGLIGSQIKGSNQSSAISTGQQQANAVLQPYVNTGENALTNYANLEGINGPDAAKTSLSNFTASPGYQYQVDQGLKAIDHGAASTGILRSGSTIKAEQTLGSNLANQDFTNYMGRLNTLATNGLSGAGQQASTDTSAGSAQAGIAGTTANGTINALTGTLGNSSVTNALSSYFNPNAKSGSVYGGTGGSGFVDSGTF